jgi:hypothetical protein
MSDVSASLPPELVAQAMTVMGQAFAAIRSATSQHYSTGERLSPERLAAVGMLADALHNVPDWLRSDLPVRYRGDEANLRNELAIAVGAIEFLHGRGPFVPRGPFRADRVQRVMPLATASVDARLAQRGAGRRASWIGGVAAVCGLGLAAAGGLRRRPRT